MDTHSPRLAPAGTPRRPLLPCLSLGLLALALALAWLHLAGLPATAALPAAAPRLPADCSASIGFGETRTCAITSVETDTFTFSASPGDVVLVRVSRASGSLWPGVKILSGATPLCTDEQVVTAEIASCTLPGGETTIQVYDSSPPTTGDYVLYLQRLNNPGHAAALGFGQTLSGTLATPAVMDTYRFTAHANDKVLLRMVNASGSLWPGLRLYDSSGAKICEQASVGQAEIANCLLPSDGAYTLLAYDGFDGTKIGNYDVFVQRLNNPGQAVALEYGRPLTATLPLPAAMGTFTITASPGDQIVVRASQKASSIWPGVRVYDPAGVQVCADAQVVTAEIASCAITAAGRYTILMYDSFNGRFTGDYVLYAQRLNNPGAAMALDYGLAVSSTISLPAAMDTYTFTAAPGDLVTVRARLAVGSLWPGLRLYDSAGVQVCQNAQVGLAEIPSCLLAAGGRYTLLVHDSFDGTLTGLYYLYLQRLDEPGNAAPLSFGVLLTDTVAVPAAMQAFTFTAEISDTVLVRASKATGDLWPGARLYDPAGSLLCQDEQVTTAEIAACDLPTAGRYTLLIYDNFDGHLTGDFGLYVQRLNHPGNTLAHEFGQVRLGAINYPAEMGAFTFTASGGDKLLLRAVRATGDLWPGVRVYAPGGAQVCAASSTSPTTLDDCTLAEAGPYLILVYDSFNGTLEGEFGLYLQSANHPSQAIPLNHGALLHGRIALPAQADTYTFTSFAGAQVSIRARVTLFPGPAFWPEVAVYDAAGSLVCSKWGSNPIEFDCVTPVTGTYTLLIFDHINGAYTGDYQLALDCCRVYAPAVVKKQAAPRP